MALQLHFYQHSRQRYSSTVRLDVMIEDNFIVRNDEIGEEFMIQIVDLRGQGGALSPKISAYGDDVGSLRKFISMGGLKLLGDVEKPDDLNRRLQALGIYDKSDDPLEVSA